MQFSLSRVSQRPAFGQWWSASAWQMGWTAPLWYALRNFCSNGIASTLLWLSWIFHESENFTTLVRAFSILDRHPSKELINLRRALSSDNWNSWAPWYRPWVGNPVVDFQPLASIYTPGSSGTKTEECCCSILCRTLYGQTRSYLFCTFRRVRSTEYFGLDTLQTSSTKFATC